MKQDPFFIQDREGDSNTNYQDFGTKWEYTINSKQVFAFSTYFIEIKHKVG
jgi:hypothetical protein